MSDPGENAMVVLYDGDCGFCKVMLAVLLRWDRAHRLGATAIQSRPGEQLLQGMPPQDRLKSWHLIDGAGALHSGGSAMPVAFAALPRGGLLARLSARFPGTTSRTYGWIADHRALLGRLLGARSRAWARRVIAERGRSGTPLRGLAVDARGQRPRVSYDPTVSRNEHGIVSAYLASTPPAEVDVGAIAYYASLDRVGQQSPSVAASIIRELHSQRSNIKLIASENYSSLASQLAHGNLFIDKYAEGYPGHRFYAGCENVDAIESEAVGLARELFGADHAYVQPHAGADANIVAFLAILGVTVEAPMLAALGLTSPVKVPDSEWPAIRSELNSRRLLAMDFYSGGHLTHGYRFNFSSRLFDTATYTVDRETKLLDMAALRRQAKEVKPHILLGGYSAYTRKINFAQMREIADEVGAVLMVDMAHFAGLVAGKVFTGDYDPVAHAHVVTSTTHKTLRGPRGGIVLCKEEFAEAVNKGCPTVLGGPLPQAIAAKAVAFREALQPEFREYAQRIVGNAQVLAEELQRRDIQVLTGGTDNHIVLANVAGSFGLTGMQAETVLRSCGLTMNRNALPFDEMGPWYTSGLRLGSAAITTLDFAASEIAEIADIIKSVLSETRPAAPTASDSSAKLVKGQYEVAPEIIASAKARVEDLLARHPVYPELNLELIASTPLGREALGEPAAALSGSAVA